jgi:sialic acid synthase SpsE
MQIIAEIGLNHCGAEARALGLLNGLARSSIDALTFQIRERAFYDGSHPRKRELSGEFYRAAVRSARAHGKKAGFAISGPEKIGFFDGIGADFWKTLSWDLTNNTLQQALQATGKKVFVSTGMSGLEDIVEASRRYGNADFIHTQLDYDLANVNLRAIETIRAATGRNVAFGLHSTDLNVLHLALAYSPSAIFFYVKDETDGEHPDDLHAVRLGEVDALARELRSLTACLGSGEKHAIENKLRPADDVTAFRPGTPSS